MNARGLLQERVFQVSVGTTLAVLVLFFAGLVLSLAASTSLAELWELLSSRHLLFAVKLSLVTATTATAGAVTLALPAAYALSQWEFRGKALVDTLLDLPIVLSPVALGAALLVFSSTPPGRFIENNIGDFVFAVPGIIIAQFTVVVALATRLLKSTFDMIDPRYLGVARVMGCSAFQACRTVALPLSRPGIIAAVILTWARAIGEYGDSVTLAGATAMKTETLPIAINLSLASAEVEKAVAVIFVLIAIAGAALLILRWLGRRSAVR